MLILKLASRNLWRHKRRTLVTASAIVFSFALLIVFIGMSDGGHAQMIEMSVRMGSGHVVVQAKGFQEDQTLDRVMHEPEAITAAIQKTLDVMEIEAHIAPRLSTSGLARAGDKSVGVLIAGGVPAIEAEVNDIASREKRIGGDWLRSREALPFHNQLSDIYVGATLADSLAVKVGDRMALTVQPPGSPTPKTEAFNVRGIFRTGTSELDGFVVCIPLAEAQSLTGVGDALTQLAILLPEEPLTASVHARLEDALASHDVEVLPWQKAMPNVYEFIVLDDASMYIFMLIVFMLVALGIFNTVLSSVIERTREFGLLTALGLRRRGVFSVVMTEAALLGVLAVLTGLGLGLLGNHYLEVHGLDYGALMGGQDFEAAGINFATVLYARLDFQPAARAVGAVFLVVILSALLPAIRAARLKALEALHHV